MNNVATDRLHLPLPEPVFTGQIHARLANDGVVIEEFRMSPPVRPFCEAVLESIGHDILDSMHPRWYKVINININIVNSWLYDSSHFGDCIVCVPFILNISCYFHMYTMWIVNSVFRCVCDIFRSGCIIAFILKAV